MNIYVGNLDYKVEEGDLKEIFEEYGSVSSAKIIVDKFNGRSKGFGFVTMDNDAEAKKAAFLIKHNLPRVNSLSANLTAFLILVSICQRSEL